MRYDGDRYGDSGDYVLTRRTLTPRQIVQVQTELSQALAEVALYALTANQNNLGLRAAAVHLFTTDASRTITGFASVGPGIKVIANRGAQDLVLSNNDASSTAENRILTHTGANITLNPSESLLIYYDPESARVRTVGFV